VAQGVGPERSPSTTKKKKTEINKKEQTQMEPQLEKGKWERKE
jgi:hypothetical protein